MTLQAAAKVVEGPQEYAFNDAHFELLRKLVGKYAGISLNDTKRQLVYGRLARRIRAMNCAAVMLPAASGASEKSSRSSRSCMPVGSTP